jgi:dihydroflavonol-4-reductase
MTDPAANGERFLAVAGDPVSAKDVADLLTAHMGAAAQRIPTKSMPDWIVRLAALVDPEARQIAPDVGKVRRATSEKARRVLGWEPRSNEDAILATAVSLVRLGLVGSRAGASE